ncbi:MAG: hypothetical protein FJX73_10100 [Armatimonadetes bacterium]|nr:hypothetical protein [Armatimonadota bacterium]
MERRYVQGLVLIVVGVVLLLAMRALPVGDQSVLFVGALLLVAYAFTGRYGLLVPAGIVTGLGAGIAAREWVGADRAPVLLGLGVGFLFIYVVDLARSGRQAAEWWPLVPGGILVAVGLLRIVRGAGILQAMTAWWPVLLVVLGIWLLVRRRAAG